MFQLYINIIQNNLAFLNQDRSSLRTFNNKDNKVNNKEVPNKEEASKEDSSNNKNIDNGGIYLFIYLFYILLSKF